MEFIEELKKALCAAVNAVVSEHGTSAGESLTSMEDGLREMLNEVGQEALGGWVSAQDGK